MHDPSGRSRPALVTRIPCRGERRALPVQSVFRTFDLLAAFPDTGCASLHWNPKLEPSVRKTVFFFTDRRYAQRASNCSRRRRVDDSAGSASACPSARIGPHGSAAILALCSLNQMAQPRLDRSEIVGATLRTQRRRLHPVLRGRGRLASEAEAHLVQHLL